MQLLRSILLFTAALLMGFAAVVYAAMSVPHLHEDMVEIAVRPTLLQAVMIGLQFGAFAMIGFTCVVLVAAIQSWRGLTLPRIALSFIALTYIAFGVASFIWSGSYHTLGYVLMGVPILLAVAIRSKR